MCCSRELTIYLGFHQETIAKTLAEISYFVHPDIVRRIQKYNYENRDSFKDLLNLEHIEEGTRNELMNAYLFKGSDCVFPFVRRHTAQEGSYNNGRFNRLKFYRRESRILDDNEIPRNLWTFLAKGGCYNADRWRDSGLSKFELAHIFNHKWAGNTEAMDSFFVDPKEDFHEAEYMFSSASNVVLIPKGMAKPTDGLQLVQKMFFQRAMDLYGNTIFRSRPDYRLSEEEARLYESLKWLAPYRPDDWEDKLAHLNEYRIERIRGILAQPVDNRNVV